MFCVNCGALITRTICEYCGQETYCMFLNKKQINVLRKTKEFIPVLYEDCVGYYDGMKVIEVKEDDIDDITVPIPIVKKVKFKLGKTKIKKFRSIEDKNGLI